MVIQVFAHLRKELPHQSMAIAKFSALKNFKFDHSTAKISVATNVVPLISAPTVHHVSTYVKNKLLNF